MVWVFALELVCSLVVIGKRPSEARQSCQAPANIGDGQNSSGSSCTQSLVSVL